MKLQDAYVTESTKLGNFVMIGYEMKSTTNFTYAEPDGNASWDGGTSDIPDEAAEVWSATSNVALNECDKGSVWKLFAGEGEGSGADYDGSVGDGKGADAGSFDQACLALTASFKTIVNDN